MPQKTSFCNRALLRSDLRHFWPAGFVYVLIWLMILPIQLLRAGYDAPHDDGLLAENLEPLLHNVIVGASVGSLVLAVVCGVERLHGADVLSADLRGGAALALAALAARGSSRLGGVEFVRRGYADLDRLLAGLGAQIWQEIPARSGVVKKTPTKKQFCLAIGAKK